MSSRGARRSSPHPARPIWRGCSGASSSSAARGPVRGRSPSLTRSNSGPGACGLCSSCGLQEGVFPARSRPQPLLSDEERLRLAQASGLMPRRGRTISWQPSATSSMRPSRGRRRLLGLSWHVASDDGEPVSRSLFVEDVLRSVRRGSVRVTRAAGARCGRRCAGAGHAHPSRSGRCAPSRSFPGCASTSGRRPRCRAGSDVRCAGSSERMLRPGAIEPDAEPLAQGALAHAALRDTLEGLRAQYGSARLTPLNLGLRPRTAATPRWRDERAPAPAVRRAGAPAGYASAPEGRPRALPGAAALADSPLEPRHLELGFGSAPGGGEGQEPQAGAVDLGGGVLMRGRIDRVDVGRGGPCRRLRLQERLRAGARQMARRGQPPGRALHARGRTDTRRRGSRRLLPAAVGPGSACSRRARPRQRDRARLRAGETRASTSGCANCWSGALRGCAAGGRRGGRGEIWRRGPPRAPTAGAACTRRSAGASHERNPRSGCRRRLPALRSPRSRSARRARARSRCCCRRPRAAARRSCSSSGSSARCAATASSRGGYSRSHSPSAQLASCASGSARACSSSANGRRHGIPRRRSSVPSTASVHVCCGRMPLPRALTPTFEILDEGLSGRLRDRAMRIALADLLRGERREAVDVVAAYRVDRVAAMISSVHAQLRSRGQREPRLPALLPREGGELEEQALAACRELDLLLAAFGRAYERLKRDARGGRLRRPRAHRRRAPGRR